MVNNIISANKSTYQNRLTTSIIGGLGVNDNFTIYLCFFCIISRKNPIIDSKNLNKFIRSARQDLQISFGPNESFYSYLESLLFDNDMSSFSYLN